MMCHRNKGNLILIVLFFVILEFDSHVVHYELLLCGEEAHEGYSQIQNYQHTGLEGHERVSNDSVLTVNISFKN